MILTSSERTAGNVSSAVHFNRVDTRRLHPFYGGERLEKVPKRGQSVGPPRAEAIFVPFLAFSQTKNVPSEGFEQTFNLETYCAILMSSAVPSIWPLFPRCGHYFVLSWSVIVLMATVN
jgi:hypothetical protein